MGSNQTASNTELSLKVERTQPVDALFLQQINNFIRATCGAACYINTAFFPRNRFEKTIPDNGR
jgi:hypothetical protein